MVRTKGTSLKQFGIPNPPNYLFCISLFVDTDHPTIEQKLVNRTSLDKSF